MGKFALQMMGAVGELERNTIVDNVKMGMKQRAKTGRHNGKVPLGYRIVEDTDSHSRNRNTRLEIVDEEAVIVIKIFQLYATGRGLKSIANELNHHSYRTKAGNPFSVCAVKDILTNPMYVGKIRYAQYENWSEKRRKGRKSNPIFADGLHEPIIPQDLWDRVQHLHQSKAQVSPRTFDGEYLLTGLLRCPQCGSAMVASRTKNRLKDGSTIIRTYYSCGSFRSKGSAVCSANSLRKQDAEATVIKRIGHVLSHPKLLQAIVENINRRKTANIKPLQDELDMIQQKISQAEEKKKRYFDLYEVDQIDKGLFSNRLNELNEELDRLHAKRSELAYQLNDDGAQTVSYELVRSLIERLDRLLQASSLEQRKTLLHLVIQKITVNDKKEIDKIELTFDERSQRHFLTCDPSATHAEGSFHVRKQGLTISQKITITI